ncbi:hypothetical protein ELI_1993 [Eubacterium callanderi]|uniref:Uncharacterized protein n=1 Tax=Eubacterium callanderi TaxID=53442 RepID=E3GDP6_9FIRM|nr:hypothetical protein ELI_1993 [Eubacterium callanderi]
MKVCGKAKAGNSFRWRVEGGRFMTPLADAKAIKNAAAGRI